MTTTQTRNGIDLGVGSRIVGFEADEEGPTRWFNRATLIGARVSTRLGSVVLPAGMMDQVHGGADSGVHSSVEWRRHDCVRRGYRVEPDTSDCGMVGNLREHFGAR